MISAAEARKMSKKYIWAIQLEQIENAIKETIIMGGHCIYYKTDMLHAYTIEWLTHLGYRVQAQITNGFITGQTEISWEE